MSFCVYSLRREQYFSGSVCYYSYYILLPGIVTAFAQSHIQWTRTSKNKLTICCGLCAIRLCRRLCPCASSKSSQRATTGDGGVRWVDEDVIGMSVAYNARERSNEIFLKLRTVYSFLCRNHPGFRTLSTDNNFLVSPTIISDVISTTTCLSMCNVMSLKAFNITGKLL